MAKQTITTEADKAAYWHRQADLMERYANKCKVPETIREHFDKAAEYREKAQQYLSPASGEAQTV